MEEIEIILEKETSETEINLINEGTIIYPELEDLEITPSREEQNFKSNKYGYDNVKVKAVASEVLDITPSEEEQTYEGLYDAVNVGKIETEEKTEELDFNNKLTIQIMPSEGKYLKKVTINRDANLIAENIKNNVKIFGVKGTAKENAIIDEMALIAGNTNTSDTISTLHQMIRKVPDIITSTWKSTYRLFAYCYLLEESPDLNVQYVTDMSETYLYCKSLKKAPLLNPVNATNMYGMFRGCESLEDASDIERWLMSPSVTDTGYMFNDCLALKKAPLFDTSNVTDMSYMFCNCKELTTAQLLNMSKVNDSKAMFSSCYKLTTVPLLDLSNATIVRYMFSNCRELTTLPEFNLGKADDVSYMFNNCYKLTTVPSFDLSNATNVTYMFSNCYELTTLPEFNLGKVTNVKNIVSNDSKLTNLGGFKDLGKGYTRLSSGYSLYTLDLSSNEELTYESLMNVVNKIYDLNLTYDVANGGTLRIQKLILGSAKGRLTPLEIAIATSKGWSVS